MQYTLFGIDSTLQSPFVKIIKTGTEIAVGSVFGVENKNRMVKLNQLKRIPAIELREDVRLTNMVQMNNVSTLSLPEQENSGEKVISSEADEFQDPTLFITNIEDNLSRISVSSHFSAPISRLRKKLIVLDLNGLLADIVSPPPKDCKADINIARRAVFKRPFCHDFLRFCFERFEVGVWSSRTQKNVERVVDFLMGDMKHKLLFCWFSENSSYDDLLSNYAFPYLMNIQDLSHCTATSFSCLENRYKALVFKELRKFWEIDDPYLPWKKGDYNESNTILLDDSPYKALLNPPHTAIFPYSYTYQNRSDNSLGAGGDLRVYLEILAESENAQKFIQQHPFGQSAITDRSKCWDFYLQAMNTLFILPAEHNAELKQPA